MKKSYAPCLVLLSSLLAVPYQAHAVDFSQPTSVAQQYVINLANNPGASRMLFISGRAPVVGISGGTGLSSTWYRTSEDQIRSLENDNKFTHVIDSVTVVNQSNGMATVFVKHHMKTLPVNWDDTFILTDEDGPWKIASLVVRSSERKQ